MSRINFELDVHQVFYSEADAFWETFCSFKFFNFFRLSRRWRARFDNPSFPRKESGKLGNVPNLMSAVAAMSPKSAPAPQSVRRIYYG